MNLNQHENALWVLHLDNMRRQNITEFQRTVEQVFHAQPRILVLDCQELKSLDYQGLKALLKCLRKSMEQECQLYLKALSAGPRMILEMTRTLQLFHEWEEV